MADRNRRALRIDGTGVALLVAAGVALAAPGGIVSAKPGHVRAKLSFRKVGFEYRKVKLSIVRNGTAFSRSLPRTYFNRPKLHVRDLDADTEPEVWVDTYTGGAHCCDQSRFFRYVAATRRYRMRFHGWGNVGYNAKNLDGRDEVELVSSDDRFAYTFTSFALSYFPLQLWHLEQGRFRDVTRRFPGQVSRHATELWSSYQKLVARRDDVRGVLAAWLADEYLLGRQQEGWKALERANRRGELVGENRGWPAGSAYLRALRSFLVRTGYVQ